MSRPANKLLSSLSAAEYRRIARHLHRVPVAAGTLLPHCGSTRTYFPTTGLCSIGSRMADGRYIEVACVGNEGVAGVPRLGAQMAAGTAYTHLTPGVVHYMTAMAFEEVCADSEFGHAVDRFCGAFLRSLMQRVSCNKQHGLEARCAGWLLMAYNSFARARFELTQEFLASANGATAKELAPVVAAMSKNGLLKHDARSVTVLDPIGLRRMACNCHTVFKDPGEGSGLRTSDIEEKPHPAPVVHFRSVAQCLLCGLATHTPHKSHADCMRAIDLEVHHHLRRAKQLAVTRRKLIVEYMAKYEKFLKRNSS